MNMSKNNCGTLRILESNEMNYKVVGSRVVVTHNGKVADYYRDMNKFVIRGDDIVCEGIKLLVKILRGDYNDEQLAQLYIEQGS